MKSHYTSLTKKGQVTINNSLSNLQGALPKPEKALSCEEIDENIRI
jgi:hypothetical protein